MARAHGRVESVLVNQTKEFFWQIYLTTLIQNNFIKYNVADFNWNGQMGVFYFYSPLVLFWDNLDFETLITLIYEFNHFVSM